MKKIVGMVLGLMLASNVFAFDLKKVDEVIDKSMDITITELDKMRYYLCSPESTISLLKIDEIQIDELKSILTNRR
jgi:hypothetical protein